MIGPTFTGSTFPRRLENETLDHLAEDDPRAIRSRADLRRINRIMGSAGIIAEALARYPKPPVRIIELGAGDGSLMLRLAKRLSHAWPGVELTLLDRQHLVSDSTREGFLRLGWKVRVLQADVLDWAEQSSPEEWDIAVANLFIHHFDAPGIALLFRALQQRSRMVVACEPLRARLPLLGSRLVGLVGANAVTREDAVLSVQAGFHGNELSALWPGDAQGWRLEERPARLFSHLFVAMKEEAQKKAQGAI
ncbi:MAG TPA: methyltransferase domain-containing protein [Noviherbaspirillum sp.]|jgi:hypothetical protein|uniref:methyltransferase domain-containing protein n=1 Tax=Noviherbaspirillum sp. TaxID=1926288 RepID=UPI002DDCC556|nr:methyltransferase domain-containing protein [Noviherbaspirillum sp.]HEV2612739.1 methyltransferase domain-containing protein [Noviherbaspirillum sp.]